MAPFAPDHSTPAPPSSTGELKSARFLFAELRAENWGGAKQPLKMVRNMLDHLERGGFMGPDGHLLSLLDQSGTMSSQEVAAVIKFHTAAMLSYAAAYDEGRLFDPAHNCGYQDPSQAADAIVEVLNKIDQLTPAATAREQAARTERKLEIMRQGARLMLARTHNPERPEQSKQWFSRARAYARKIKNFINEATP